MLDPGRYLLGVAEVGLLAGFAWLGASALRRRLIPGLSGAPARLATAVLALAFLLWAAELLGSFGAFSPLPYLLLVASVGLVCWTLLRGWRRPGHLSQATERDDQADDGTRGRGFEVITLIAFVIAAIATVHFAAGVRLRLGTGMTGFDSTWYHGPFAAGFFQSGNTWDLHFIAPQFQAWFYPASSELFHAIGMLAFDRDVLSPLLNLGWFAGCLVACWCIGRPYGVAPWSLALGAIALSVPALSDQAGEARNDIVGLFFLLAAVAIAINAWAAREGGGRKAPIGALAVVGLAAGMAAGTKLNFLLPCAVVVVGLGVAAPRGERLRALLVSALAALAGGGYWYLRNLAHTGNPLPWAHHLGPITLPAPEQALGGREAHSVLGYLTDGAVWSDWFLPGLHSGFWILWPLLLLTALAGLLLCLVSPVPKVGGGEPAASSRPPSADSPGSGLEGTAKSADVVLRIAALAGLAAALAWLVAPTSASGLEGMPRGFESGLRYLAPALVLGLALLPTTPLLRERLSGLALRSLYVAHSGTNSERSAGRNAHAWLAAGVLVLAVVAIGYPVQRHYLGSRYADPSFTAPGLNAAFAWARDISGADIATTSTRQYPLFGTDLSNRVQYVGVETPHGGFVGPQTCGAWRRLLNKGDYDYVVASRDRIEPGKSPYPPTARWTEGPGAKVILRIPPTVVFQLKGPLDPSACK
jgi:hypothetical protein